MSEPAHGKEQTNAIKSAAVFSGRPGRSGALVDLLVYVATALGFWEIEEWLRAVDKFPMEGLFDGGMSLILSLLVVVVLTHRRGQSPAHLGLKRPSRWWTIPLWGFIALLVNVVVQGFVIPPLGALLNVPPPDFSRYGVLEGNLALFVPTVMGAMFTGGFIEEVIYRGFIIDRLGRIFGGGRRALLVAALTCGVPFGLVHFQWGIGGMFVTAVMGAILGLMFLATRRNLWPLIAAHAVLDLILLLQVYLGMLNV